MTSADRCASWSLAILGALEPAPSAEALERGNRSVDEMNAYLNALIARAPRQARRSRVLVDVLTRLFDGRGRRAADGEGAHSQLHLPAQRRT